MLFKMNASFLELRWPFSLAWWNLLCNFGKGNYEEQFCVKIVNKFFTIYGHGVHLDHVTRTI